MWKMLFFQRSYELGLPIFCDSVAVILNGKLSIPDANSYATYSQYNGFAHLAAGLCTGLSSLASGLAIGIAADAGTRAVGTQSAMAASWKTRVDKHRVKVMRFL
jgi:F0F1-type ATP synthase membrane subunit c/vacuolar-type H+-ATPase subunit K